MTWRNAHSLTMLLTQINKLYPDRYKGTDGGISGYTYGPGGVVVNPNNYSGHNINSRGVICAFDITTGDYPGGISTNDGQRVAEGIRLSMRDQARGLTPYVIHWMDPPYVAISGAKIATAHENWAWNTYFGEDPHKSHIHPSVDWDIPHNGAPSGLSDYDNMDPWKLDGISAQGSDITEIEELSMADLNKIAQIMLDTEVDKNDKSGTITLRQFLSYADGNQAWMINEIKKVASKVADIQTSPGQYVPLRQFIADGTRAAQTAAKQTADINLSGGKTTSLRQMVSDGTRAAQKLEPIVVDIAEAVKAPAVDNVDKTKPTV